MHQPAGTSGAQTQDRVVKLKIAWHNGTTHIVLEAMEFIQRLMALVPRPRLHLTQVSRRAGTECEAAFAGGAEGCAGDSATPRAPSAPRAGAHAAKARLLTRVFDIDIEQCACGGKLTLIAVPSPGSGQGSSSRM